MTFAPTARLLLACGLALAALGTHAAPPKKEGTLGGGKGGGPIMSMAELRACVARQARLDGQSAAAVKAQQEMVAERSAIDEAGAKLKDDMATLNRTDVAAVEAYVARAKAHDQRIDAYEARVPAYNAQVELLNAERAGYAKACEGRRYLEDDYKDIKAGK